MNCLYTGYCSQENTDECSQSCTKYVSMQFLMDKALIPEKRRVIQEFSVPEIDKDIFNKLGQICHNIKRYVDEGENIVLYSERPGNGKTSWAIKLLIAYFDSVWHNNAFKVRGYFIHVPTYLSRIKAAMNEPDAELEEIQKKILDVDILVLDDLGATSVSEYDVNVLTRVIDQRWLDKKTIIYTTNRDRRGLTELIGARMADRVFDSSVYHFKSGSSRGI